MPSRRMKFNFCNPEHRITYSKSAMNISMSKGWKHTEEVKAKIRNHYIEKYGVEHSFQREDVKEKIVATCMERYGVPSAAQSVLIQEQKVQMSRRQRNTA